MENANALDSARFVPTMTKFTCAEQTLVRNESATAIVMIKIMDTRSKKVVATQQPLTALEVIFISSLAYSITVACDVSISREPISSFCRRRHFVPRIRREIVSRSLDDVQTENETHLGGYLA